jgi:hypothetical protein
VKFVSIWKCSPAAADSEHSDEEMARMGQLIGEMMQAGVLMDTGGVMSGGASFRARRAGQQVAVTDGPFTETKEMVGGFAILNVQSKDEAERWTRRFVECAGDGEAELHEVTPLS